MLRALHITKGTNGGWGVLVIIILHLIFLCGRDMRFPTIIKPFGGT